MAERLQHARLQAILRIDRGGFAHHALIFGELLIEQQRIFPVKLRGVGHDAYLLNRILSDLKTLDLSSAMRNNVLQMSLECIIR